MIREKIFATENTEKQKKKSIKFKIFRLIRVLYQKYSRTGFFGEKLLPLKHRIKEENNFNLKKFPIKKWVYKKI